jgi:hypothetical protein
MNRETRVDREELIARYERAARIYCAKEGVDPDVEVPTPHPALAGVVLKRQYWQIIAEHMGELSLLMTSMREGHGPILKVVN